MSYPEHVSTDVELAEFISSWCDRENIPPDVRECMLTIAAEDPDYWASQSCWRLFDRANLGE